jgi:hypothetical protein
MRPATRVMDKIWVNLRPLWSVVPHEPSFHLQLHCFPETIPWLWTRQMRLFYCWRRFFATTRLLRSVISSNNFLSLISSPDSIATSSSWTSLLNLSNSIFCLASAEGWKQIERTDQFANFSVQSVRKPGGLWAFSPTKRDGIYLWWVDPTINPIMGTRLGRNWKIINFSQRSYG